MARSFTDYMISRITEADEGAKRKVAVFQNARAKLARMIDAKFAELNGQLQKSFGSQQKVDKNSRDQIVQVLGKIATRIGSWGDQSAVAESIKEVNSLLLDADMLVEDNNSPKIVGVSNHLDSIKDDIMKQIDKTMSALERDSLMKVMSDIHQSVDKVHGQLSGANTPFSSDEQVTAADHLQALGNAMRGAKDIQILDAEKRPLDFNPNSSSSINRVIERLNDPKNPMGRNVTVIIGGRRSRVDLSNSEMMTQLITAAQTHTKKSLGGVDAGQASADKLGSVPIDSAKTGGKGSRTPFDFHKADRAGI
jgi:hypothetical protein